MKKYLALLLVAVVLLAGVVYATVDTLEGEELTNAANIEGVTTGDTVEGQVLTAGGAVPDGQIGLTGEDASYEIKYNDYLYHQKQQPSTPGNVRYARARVYNMDGNSINLCLAEVNGGGDDTIVLCCNSGAISGDGAQWVSCDGGSTYEVLASTDYYIGYELTNDEGDTVISTPGSGQGYYDDIGASDPCTMGTFTGEATSTANHRNVYWNNIAP